MEEVLKIAPPVASICVFVAPLKTMADVRRNQTTGDLPPLTFVSMAVMSAIWGTYGGLRGDSTVLVPNMIGSAFSLYYLHVFENYAPKGAKANELSRWYQVGIVLLGLILLQVTFGELRQAGDIVGTCGAVLSVIFSLSPLQALPAVMKSRSPDAIPLATAAMMFTNSALWMSYGNMVNDNSIYVPNFVGALSSAIQLGVHAAFKLGLISRNVEGVKVASL